MIAAFVGLLLGVVLAALNQTMVATALPTIVHELGGMTHYNWVFSAYMLALTVTVPLYGRLSDIHGRRPVFTAGIVIFLTGAVVGATAQSMMQLVIARTIQGLGAGALIPIAMAAIGDLVPARDRGRWQGVTGALLGVAATLGPLAGGWIVDNADWRWVFLVPLPVGFAALLAVMLTLRIAPHPERTTSMDYVGAALLTGGLIAALAAILPSYGGVLSGSPHGIALLAAGGTFFVAFGRQERRVEHPIVPPELFLRRAVLWGVVAAAPVGTALFGTVMLAPLLVQAGIGGSATSAGLVLTPLMLAMMMSSVVSGHFIARTGQYRWPLLSGPVLMLAAFAILSGFGPEASRGSVTTAMILMGLGVGLVLQNLVLIVQNSAPSQHMGVATGTTQLFRNAGAALGVAILGTLLPKEMYASAAEQSSIIGGPSAAIQTEMVEAIQSAFALGIPLMVAMLAVVALIPQLPLSTAGDPSGEALT